MLRLLNAPSSTLIGEGHCIDEEGLASFSIFSCTFCDAGANTTACASNCWDLQETYLNPLLAEFHDKNRGTNIHINTVGYQHAEDVRLCQCLLDTDLLHQDERTTVNLLTQMFDLAGSTGNSFAVGEGGMGPIAGSSGDDRSCYAFNETGTETRNGVVAFRRFVIFGFIGVFFVMASFLIKHIIAIKRNNTKDFLAQEATEGILGFQDDQVSGTTSTKANEAENMPMFEIEPGVDDDSFY